MHPHHHAIRQRLPALALSVVLACSVVLGLAGSAAAQTNIYLDYEGLPGSTVAEGYGDKIEVASISFGVARGISPFDPDTGKREASNAVLSEITLTLPFDAKAFPALFLASCNGVGSKVTISTVARLGGGSNFVPLKIELEQTLISSFSSSSSTGDSGAGFASITLDFLKISITTIQLDPSTGQPRPEETKTWNRATNDQ